MAEVLIIDDDEMFCSMLANHIKALNYQVDASLTIEDALEKNKNNRYDVIYLDVNLSDGNGLNILPKLKAAESEPEVIIITGLMEADGAKLAIKNGAWDYTEKQSSVDAMLLPLIRAMEYRKEKIVVAGPVALKREGIIGNSPVLTRSLNFLAKSAKTDSSVLLIGETGTGKELFATAIHENSGRVDGELVVVDCAAMPDNLVESILFGHKRGAFTGADRDRVGLVTQADGGTLFLDEIGELSLPIQASFLRVLQTGRYRPVGASSEIESDFRLVAATNRNLRKMVAEGNFREDLLFRVEAIQLELPPLRSRTADIPGLAIHYISKMCSKRAIPIKGLSADFLSSLLSYAWPGNIRELINALETALIKATNAGTLYNKHLPEYIQVQNVQSKITKRLLRTGDVSTSERTSKSSLPPFSQLRAKAIETIEKEYLKDLLQQTSGKITKACHISGLSRSRLYELLQKYKLGR